MKDSKNRNKIINILNFSNINGKITCGREYKNTMSAFEIPCNLKILGIEIVTEEHLSDDHTQFYLDSFIRKCIRVPVNDNHVIFPILY